MQTDPVTSLFEVVVLSLLETESGAANKRPVFGIMVPPSQTCAVLKRKYHVEPQQRQCDE